MPLIRFDDEGGGGFRLPNEGRAPSTQDDGGIFGPGPDWTRQPDAGGMTGRPTTFEPGTPNGSGFQPTASQGGGTASAGIPTNPDGSQIGSGIPWAKGADRPSYDPAGYHWDASFGMFQPNGAGDTSRTQGKPAGGRLSDPSYVDSLLAYYGSQAGVNPSVKNDPNYWRQRILSGAFGEDEGYLVKRFFQAEGAPEGGGNQRVGIGGTLMGGRVFEDPATQQWEQVLRGLAGKMSEPYTPPGFAPLEEYMTKYFQQLQGPAYTPEQTALMQTQSIEPLTQERDAQRQRLMQSFSQRGIGPDSGIAQDQSNQLDRQYAQLRSQRERDLAVGAVNQQNQNRQQATQVGSQLAGLQAQLQAANEARATRGLDLLSQIPQLADKRLQLALQSMSGQQINPTSLLANLQGFQGQQMYQQQNDQAFWANIGGMLAKLFGG